MEAAGTDEVGVPEVRDTEPVEFVPDGKMIESDADCEGVMTGAEPLELPLAEILPEAEMLDPEGVLTGWEIPLAEPLVEPLALTDEIGQGKRPSKPQPPAEEEEEVVGPEPAEELELLGGHGERPSRPHPPA